MPVNDEKTEKLKNIRNIENTSPGENPGEPLTTLRLSVRDFVSGIYREGGLGTGSIFSMQDNIGTKIHQQFFKAFEKSNTDCTLYIEHTLKKIHLLTPILFDIQGRADLIVESPDHQIQVIEIKTIAKAGATVPDKVDFLHLAQARVYAYFFCLEKGFSDISIQITIKYILIHSFQIRDFHETLSFSELERFFLDTCAQYADLGKSIHAYELARNESIKKMAFPYPNLRSGQKEFMNTVLTAIRKREPLIIQAPTGTGKTISTLYPAIKGIPAKYGDYIFYITAKSSTQDVAKKTLDDMREQGLILKSIQITAKEKICLCRELYCDMSICPYAIRYYEQSPKAMKELSKHFAVDAKLLQETGEKYQVCPFELGLDVSLYCDVILCDYNYVFDPKVRLDRFINQESLRLTILVDEAHNLPDRCNEMYSAAVSLLELKEIMQYRVYLPEEIKNTVDGILAYFDRMSLFMSDGELPETSFDAGFQPRELFRSSSFCATRKQPKTLLKYLDTFVTQIREELDKIQDSNAKKAFTDFFFSAKFFVRIALEFFNTAYITTFIKEGRDTQIILRCMDSAAQIASFHQGRHSVIFFSATLSPIPYFESKFKLSGGYEELKKLVLPSPFPRENLFLGIVPGISTKYANRHSSLVPISEIIDAATSCKTGNYLVYSPSFEYQQWIIHAFEEQMRYNKPEVLQQYKIIRQTSGMNEKQRQNFLREFQVYGNRTLIGFAVMGGIFGEGIDLTGETLSGVILIGPGLPKKSAERDIMMDYYSSIHGNGFNFAYRYPGFNKILQAAGRVIRSENDRGFILLLDERYETPEYRILFPEEWEPVTLKNKNQIKKSLLDFFGSV